MWRQRRSCKTAQYQRNACWAMLIVIFQEICCHYFFLLSLSVIILHARWKKHQKLQKYSEAVSLSYTFLLPQEPLPQMGEMGQKCQQWFLRLLHKLRVLLTSGRSPQYMAIKDNWSIMHVSCDGFVVVLVVVVYVLPGSRVTCTNECCIPISNILKSDSSLKLWKPLILKLEACLS